MDDVETTYGVIKGIPINGRIHIKLLGRELVHPRKTTIEIYSEMDQLRIQMRSFALRSFERRRPE